MLNRFQFARLRAFRKGTKKNGSTDGRREAQDRRDESYDRGSQGSSSSSGSAHSGVGDSWEDDDRVARLLARRAAAQELERQEAMDRLGPRGAAAATAPPPIVSAPTPVDRTTAVPKDPDTAEPASQVDARTTTIPPLASPEPRTDSKADTGWHRQGPRGAAGVGTASARVVCIASGKGGTGKSVLASNLAILRARRGERVLLVDFDAGLANAHLLLGLVPPYDVGHVMEGEVTAHQALVEGPHGLKLLAGGVGRQTMIDPTRRELDRLFKALRPLESEFDLILIDHGAGLSYSTVAHLAATSTLILVTNHEVTALSDGYALYKRAHMVNSSIRVGLVVNRAPDERIAMDAWERFRFASHKFLGHTPELIGWIPADPAIPQAVQMRQPAVLSYPESPAARALKRVAGWPPIDHARTASAFYDKARRALR